MQGFFFSRPVPPEECEKFLPQVRRTDLVVEPGLGLAAEDPVRDDRVADDEGQHHERAPTSVTFSADGCAAASQIVRRSITTYGKML